MYTIRYKYWRVFFHCLLVASSLVLFGNRLTDRFHLCTSLSGGLYQVKHNGHKWYPGHTDFGVHKGKVLSSVSKRYHSPVGFAIDAPAFRIQPVVLQVMPMGYVLPLQPMDSFASGLFLRGPPSRC